MFNNYIFKVDLETPATPSSFPGGQACTTPPPATGVSTLVVRMSNARAEGLNNANRVENDVSASWLIRQSIAREGLDPVVPAVYAWAPYRARASAAAATEEEEEEEEEAHVSVHCCA